MLSTLLLKSLQLDLNLTPLEIDILVRINAGLKWMEKLVSGFLPAPSRKPLKIAVITTKACQPEVNK